MAAQIGATVGVQRTAQLPALFRQEAKIERGDCFIARMLCAPVDILRGRHVARPAKLMPSRRWHHAGFP